MNDEDFYDQHRKQLYDLIDLVWNTATESTTVPSYEWADNMIDQWLKNLRPTGSQGGSGTP
jgi:hypothetical protein